MKTAKCKGCGADLIWSISPAGKRIPMDARPTVYRLTEQADGTVVAEKLSDQATLAVSHFATCSKVDQFGGGSR